jgi:small subunit ribosomal protein S6
MACGSGRKRRLRYYELMLVVSPQVDDEGLTVTLDRVNRYVSDHGGSVVRQEQWGRLRRLAYPIRNYNEGNYVLTHLEMDPQDTKDLEASLHLTEDVLRHLLVRVDSIPPAPAPRAEPVEAAAESTEAAAEATQTEATVDSTPTSAEATDESTEAEAAQTETTADDAPASPEAQAPEAAAEVTEPETSTEPAEAQEESGVEANASSEGAEEPPAEEPATGGAQ